MKVAGGRGGGGTALHDGGAEAAYDGGGDEQPQGELRAGERRGGCGGDGRCAGYLFAVTALGRLREEEEEEEEDERLGARGRARGQGP